MTPDVNVVIAAFRRDHPHHDIARAWLEQARSACASGTTSLVLLSMVVVAFLRLVTNARVFVVPDSVEDAVAFVDLLLATPGAELSATATEWPLLRARILSGRLQGNSVTDAWIAAATQALSEHLVTFDRDFRRLLPDRDLTILQGPS